MDTGIARTLKGENAVINPLRAGKSVRIAGCALLIFLTGGLSAGLEERPVDEAFINGSLYFYDDKYEECLASMDSVIADDPDFLEAHLMRGMALMMLGRLDEASTSYMVYCARDPMKPEGFNLVGKLLFDYGHYGFAENFFVEARKIAPGDPGILNNLGSVYVRTGRLDRARETFEKGLEVDPAVPELHLNLGIVYFIRNDLEAAEGAFLDAIALNRDVDVNDPVAHANLGDVYIELGELDKAVDAFCVALEYDATLSDVRTRLGMVLEYLGDTALARSQYETAIAVGGELPQAHSCLAGIYVVEGRIREAVRELESAARMTGNRDPAPLEDLARIHDRMERYGRALEYYRMAFDAGSRSAWVLSALSRLCEHQGYDSEALVYFKLLEEESSLDAVSLFEVARRSIESRIDRIRNPEKGLEISITLAEETGWQHPGVLDLMAMAHANLGDYGKAADLQRTAIALIPRDSLILPMFEERLTIYSGMDE